MIPDYNYSYPTGLAPLPEEEVEQIEFALHLAEAADALPHPGAFRHTPRFVPQNFPTTISRGG